MRKQGLFIVVDGPSASGKDTIISQVLKDLDKLGLKAISIEETKEKDYDRAKILATKKLGDHEVARAIINERKKLYETKVIPQLISGNLVIANRGEPTTLVYQTLKNKLTMEHAWRMHRAKDIPLPNLIVIANCSVQEAIRREKLRKESLEEKDKSSMSGKFTSARKQIHANYEMVKDFLEKKGLWVIYLNTDKMNVTEESQRIVSFLKNKINYLHE